jgi:hypothetical protein
VEILYITEACFFAGCFSSPLIIHLDDEGLC